MGIVFVWNEKYAVGETKLDNQHRYLFDLGNKIESANESEAKAYIMKLYKYAIAHFTAEETHMKKIKYPDLENHRKLHDKFITDLNLIAENFSNESFEKFKSFLYSWLIQHILNEDNKYFLFSNSRKLT